MPKMSTRNLQMAERLTLKKVVFADGHFTTHLNDAFDKPLFEKCASFVSKYQAMTPESESKVRVFFPFPRRPKRIPLTDTYIFPEIRGLSDSMDSMNTVKRCQTELMPKLYKQFLDKFAVLEKEN